jgi:hypothetical protein
MIVPITTGHGKDDVIGTVSIQPDGDDFSVEFYLRPGYTLAEQVVVEMTKQLKKRARQQRLNISMV